jgi:hypothetical protein
MPEALTEPELDGLDHIVGGLGDAEVLDVADVGDGCTVAILRGHPEADFVCLGCEAQGYADGYVMDEDGAAEWHAEL